MKSWFYSRLPRIQFSVIIKLRQTNKQLMYTNQLRRVHTGIIQTDAGWPPFFHINRVYHIEPVVHFVREQTGATMQSGSRAYTGRNISARHRAHNVVFLRVQLH